MAFCAMKKSLVEALNGYKKQEEERRSRFFFKKWLRKKYSNSLNQQTSETKQNTKLVLK